MAYYTKDFALALCFIMALGYMLARYSNLGRFERVMLPVSGGIAFTMLFVVSHMIARFFK
jgi:hypothetical protein